MINIEIVEQKRISWEEAISIGMSLRENKDNSQWNLGDLALKIEKSYGVDSLGRFAIDININKNSLIQYRRVSASFPLKTRSKVLSHRHHLILAGHEERFKMLKQCEEENITTSQLERMYSRNPQSNINRKEVLVCETCQKLVVNQKNICLCGKEKQ